MEKFRDLKLNKNILKVIEELGFSEPTEIQEKTIPLILEGKDILGSSSTGSGKTLAFGVGIIERIKKGEGVKALVLSPTRELAEQSAKNIRVLSANSKLFVKEIYGGVAFEPQVTSLRKADIVVGTPGRILDHLNRKTLDLRNVHFLVLDEADRMLEMGFIRDVEKIIHSCPRERQTLFFSATIDADIERLSLKYMKHPVRVEVESYVDPSKLHQSFYDVPQGIKFSLLAHLLKNEKKGLVMVFCNTRVNSEFVAKNLQRHKIHAVAIHGGMPQNKRNKIIQSFHSGEVLILVCTDVATRGLDIKNVSHIYNYDLPRTSTEYIHRIGRTARAGEKGIAISLVSSRDYENFRNICDNESIKIKEELLPRVDVLPININNERRSFRRDSRNRGRNTSSHHQRHNKENFSRNKRSNNSRRFS